MRNLRTENEIIKRWNGSVDAPLVSISCITYNHEKYIEDALEGFLSQETDFPFEVLIHDDASTDRTAEIVREYEARFPQIIKPVYQKENQHSKRVKISLIYQYPRAKGKYIALCEGDDYWTDNNKLQLQIDFLEKNKSYAMSSHDIKFVWDGVEEEKNYYDTPITDASFDQILDNWFIAYNSIVFRSEYYRNLPDWVYKLPGGHKVLVLIVTSHGNNYHFSKIMGVKRRNPGGITFREKTWRDNNKLKYNILMFEGLKNYLNHAKDKPINRRLLKLYKWQARIEIRKLHFIKAAQYLLRAFPLLWTDR